MQLPKYILAILLISGSVHAQNNISSPKFNGTATGELTWTGTNAFTGITTITSGTLALTTVNTGTISGGAFVGDGSGLTDMIWSQIGSTPTTLSGYGITDAATFAQGALADSATQPEDLGTASAEDVGYFATSAQGALADSALQPDGDGSGLGEMTKSQVGLSNVDNTSDTNKPVSTAQQTALDLKQPKVDFISSAPATATSTGTTGQLIYAGNYLYICIATDTWLRAQLLTW